MNPNNIMQMLAQFAQFRQDPMAKLSEKFNIPQNINDPNQIIQHLLNTNQVTQDLVNQAMQMRDNPIFRGLFG